MAELNIKPYTFWYAPESGRKFLVVDIPLHANDSLVLMEIRAYSADAERKFEKVNYQLWKQLTEKQQLKEFVPVV